MLALARVLTMIASSREEGMSSTLRYASTVDTFLPAVTGPELSLLLSARMVSWLAFSSKSSWFSFCFFLQCHPRRLTTPFRKLTPSHQMGITLSHMPCSPAL